VFPCPARTRDRTRPRRVRPPLEQQPSKLEVAALDGVEQRRHLTFAGPLHGRCGRPCSVGRERASQTTFGRPDRSMSAGRERRSDEWSSPRAPSPTGASLPAWTTSTSAGRDCRSATNGAVSRAALELRLAAGLDDEQERRSRLLLVDETGSLRRALDPRLAAPSDESEQRPTRGARTCSLLLSTDAGVSARTQLTLAWDEDQASAAAPWAPPHCCIRG